MARRKGSKNRTTLERELREAGVIVTPTMTYSQLAEQAGALPKPTAPLPAPAEQSIVAPEEARAIIDDTRRRFARMVDYYTKEDDTPPAGDATFIPERIQEYLRGKVFMAATVDEAREHARRALDKLHSHLLMLWGRKRVTGPDTPSTIKKRAQKAEKWATRLEKLGKVEEARAQRAKVAAIRATEPQADRSPWA